MTNELYEKFETTNSNVRWDLLERAADALVDQNIKCYMPNFRSDYYGCRISQTKLTEPCGTSGCFLGNCPFLGIPELELKESDLSLGSLKWYRYCERVFNISAAESPELWDYLFGSGKSGDPKDILKRVITAKEKWGKR